MRAELGALILQLDRIRKGLTLAPNGRVTVDPILQAVIAMDDQGLPTPFMRESLVSHVPSASTPSVPVGTYDGAGCFQVGLYTTAGLNVGSHLQTVGLYSSDGVAAISYPGYMRHVSVEITSAADGSLAAGTAFLAAGGAGVKWVLYDISLSQPTGGGGGHITISDSGGYVGVGGNRKGPTKQGTANTAMTILAVAGDLENSKKYVLNCSYRAGA